MDTRELYNNRSDESRFLSFVIKMFTPLLLIRVLCSTEQGCLEHTLLQTGDINAVLGLPGWKLVCSCGTLQTQSIEMNTLSKEGRSEFYMYYLLSLYCFTLVSSFSVSRPREILYGLSIKMALEFGGFKRDR